MPSDPRCSFCSRSLAEVAYLFPSLIGATPACICDACIAERMGWLDMERTTPGFLAGVIEIQRARLSERWAESHPISAHLAL